MTVRETNANNILGCIAARINLTTLLCLTLLLEPKLFVKFPAINYFYIAGAVAVFCVVMAELMRCRIKLGKFFVFALLYRLAIFPQTVLQNGELLDWGYYTLTLLALIGYFESMADAKERLSGIDNVAFLLLLYLFLNFVVLLIAPGGVIDGLYFLGYRTRIVEVIIVAIVSSAYVDCCLHKCSFRTVFFCLIGLIQIVILWVATAVVGLAVLVLSLLAFRYSKGLCKPTFFHVITLAGIVATIAFCIFNVSFLFSGFIQSVLHKSASLSDRTYIWALAVQMFKASPLLGYGVVDNGNHILWVTNWMSMYWQAHNNILQILLDGGLLSFIPYLAMLFYVGGELRKKHLSGVFLAVILSAWLAINVMAVSEIFVLQNYFFLFLIIILIACSDCGYFLSGEIPEVGHEI